MTNKEREEESRSEGDAQSFVLIIELFFKGWPPAWPTVSVGSTVIVRYFFRQFFFKIFSDVRSGGKRA